MDYDEMITSDDIFIRFVMMLSDEDVLSLPVSIRTEDLYARFPAAYELARSLVLQRREALSDFAPDS